MRGRRCLGRGCVWSGSGIERGASGWRRGGRQFMAHAGKHSRRMRNTNRVLSVAALVVLLGLFAAGLRWNFGVGVPFGGAAAPGAYLLGVENGALHFSKSGVTLLGDSPQFGGQRRWEPVIWWPTFVSSWVGMFVHVPFWIPVVGMAGWVGWAWRRRPREVGCARCGYDLAGLKGGVCPECGGYWAQC